MKKHPLIWIWFLFSFFSLFSCHLFAQTERAELYYSPSCQHCREITDYFLPQMQGKYPNVFEVDLMDITLPENQARLLEMEKTYGFQYQPPTLILSGIILTGEEQIKNQLEAVLANLAGSQNSPIVSPPSPSSSPAAIPVPKDQKTTTALREKLSSWSLLTIITAGALDGINPCAFTTIIFFISFLGFAGYKQRQIRWIGVFFILAVFLTYLGIGFGLLRFLHTLVLFPLVSKGIIWLTAILTAFLSFFSLKDFWVYRATGQTRDWSLQLPLSIKQRIHRVIGEGYRSSGDPQKTKRPLGKLIGTAFVTGFLVSSLESVCTGQLYVPTLVYMTKFQETTLQAWSYLLLYNSAFIFPLVLVFLLSLWGITSQQFGQLATRHLGTVKLGTAVFFLAMTALLIRSVL